MRCSNCGVCCTETEMLLCEKDIERLVKRGFSRSFFAKVDREGYAQLKNRQGYCVFYDSEKTSDAASTLTGLQDAEFTPL